ncbi:MAG TPA: hypothetical protein VNW15_00180 [Rhizomicrobium sp.]|nr:hypothetical protein [Rhizomicrobium sp.]
MTKKLAAGLGAIVSLLAAMPAQADSAADFGKVSVTLGGFLASEGVYRSRDEQADIGSSYSGVPYSNLPQGHTSEIRFSARQSRLSLLVQGDLDANTHIAMWNEFDFLGGAQTANSNESNSYNLRIRNMYATIDWDSLGLELLAGQNWSLLTLNSHGITPRNEVAPTTIDAQYVVGFNWARQAQLRITKNWDKEFWASVSVENPQTSFAANAAAAQGVSVTNLAAGGPEFDKTNNFSLNHTPDLIGKFAWEPAIDGARPLHVELFGIYRSFYDRINTNAVNALGARAQIHNVSVPGGGLGGSVTWTAVPKLLDLQLTSMTGQGIGRYGTGQLPDVTFKPDGALAPARETTLLAGATVHATPALDLYGYAGQEGESAKYYDVGTAHFGLGNPAYNLAGCAIEGGACSPNLESLEQVATGFWWKSYQGKFGSFRLGMQYSYTHLSAFAGAGGKPTTDDNMLFSSIRYYPF